MFAKTVVLIVRVVVVTISFAIQSNNHFPDNSISSLKVQEIGIADEANMSMFWAPSVVVCQGRLRLNSFTLVCKNFSVF